MKRIVGILRRGDTVGEWEQRERGRKERIGERGKKGESKRKQTRNKETTKKKRKRQRYKEEVKT